MATSEIRIGRDKYRRIEGDSEGKRERRKDKRIHAERGTENWRDSEEVTGKGKGNM